MKKLFLGMLVFIFLLSSCTTTAAVKTLTPLPDFLPKIDRHPRAAEFIFARPAALPKYNVNSDDYWQVDLRSKDLTALDLSNSFDDLIWADFDTKTIWPESAKMPANYDWEKILSLGKDPGLGIQQLHQQGITGRGIGIAIIDQPLLVDHSEYVDQLRFYEETDDIADRNREATMHGTAVASIAVGKTVGVAPEADLYFIGTSMCSSGTYESIDFACLAKGVRRVLEINSQLPEDRKIRVLAMEIGWDSGSKGYEEITAAAQEAKKQGLLVICSSVEEVHGFKFHGLGRDPLADPERFNSYEPGIFWAKNFYENDSPLDRLMVPMDSRTTASPTGVDDYVFYREGGWSWSIPYIAGVYALAAQVDPEITPDEFWSLAMQTGKTIELDHDGQRIPFGPILDAQQLIRAVKEKR